MLICISTVLIFGCQNQNVEQTSSKKFITDEIIAKVVGELTTKYGETQKIRIEKGVSQAASLWIAADGTAEEFQKFCADNFIAKDSALQIAFEKIQRNYEILWGNFNKVGLDLRIPMDLNEGEITPIDLLFGSYDVGAHLNQDFFANKIAFTVILNFPAYCLKEKQELGVNWTRQQWAYARVGDIYTARIPAELQLKYTETVTKADSYISEYNIFMGNLINDKNEMLFPKEMKLITHWGLRDELKANYKQDKGLEKQRMIYEVMKHIILQDIPNEVINKSDYQWNPTSNKIFKDSKELAATPEGSKRYEILLNNFKATSALDPYCPQYPTYIQRKFEQEMEIPQEDVEKLFIELVSSPQVKKVAELIKRRLGRDLEPFDIWYDGFKARNSISEDVLNKATQTKSPTRDAIQADLPNILQKLGFAPEKANYISYKIRVDASRGAGHAAGAYMKGDKARLRTRVTANGADYKGYNIAVHEFGHTVEQTLSLYDVDYYMLNGVPNTSFTEALAFIFQHRDLELIGMKDPNPNKEYLSALDNFLSCYEIMGVSLVDMQVWKWLYANPNATPEQLKEQVITIAKEVWNKYYADVFGSKDQPILAIYSHMIDYPLYLSAYPIGHIIEFQVEKQLKSGKFADEVIRMYTKGRILPQFWMKNAVGSEISIKPTLEAADEAVTKF